MASFIETQKILADHLRDPVANSAPANIEDRRLNIYRDLIFKNIESFISGGFPILRSLYSEDDWHQLVRSFIRTHHSDSPYFLEVSQEFLRYLQEEHQRTDSDPAFMLELAHYEWVELALDVSEESIPRSDQSWVRMSYYKGCRSYRLWPGAFLINTRCIYWGQNINRIAPLKNLLF